MDKGDEDDVMKRNFRRFLRFVEGKKQQKIEVKEVKDGKDDKEKRVDSSVEERDVIESSEAFQLVRKRKGNPDALKRYLQMLDQDYNGNKIVVTAY